MKKKGAIGSAGVTPTDLVKVRLQMENGKINKNGIYITGLYKGKKPTYKHTFDAFYQIYKKYGIFNGLYQGCIPTVLRASVSTAGQIVSYDHSKYMLKKNQKFKENFELHIIASIISGFIGTLVCAPFDFLKTQIMGDIYKNKYLNLKHCLFINIKKHGFIILFRGWWPSYCRQSPAAIISFPLLEQIRIFFGLSYFGTSNH